MTGNSSGQLERALIGSDGNFDSEDEIFPCKKTNNL